MNDRLSSASPPVRLRQLLIERRIRENAIADLLGISSSGMSRRMTGVMEFRASELQKIAAYIEVPVEQLLAPAPEPSAGVSA